MSRAMTIKQRAARAAREFRGGRGRAWPWVVDRDAIIDAECMDQVRYAAAYADGAAPLTVEQLIEFRLHFVEAITKMGYAL